MEELKNSDFEIIPGEPDITDWEVMNEHGEKIGDVDDVLFDNESRKVRYIIVDMEINTLMIENPYQVLIPIGLAKINEAESQVIITNVSVKQLNELPKYESDRVTPEYEISIRNILEENIVIDSVEAWENFYDHEHFNGNGFSAHNDENRNERILKAVYKQDVL
jgi:sporulation protein YlmC with PRC-barrel domain